MEYSTEPPINEQFSPEQDPVNEEKFIEKVTVFPAAIEPGALDDYFAEPTTIPGLD